MFCELCGQQFFPKQSTCSRCRAIPARYWLQFLSLVTLFVAIASNSLLGWYLLPRYASGTHPRPIFRAWLWFDHKLAFYGWIPLAGALLAWDYLIWKHGRPKIRGWITRKLLSLVLVAGVAPILPWWIPADRPPNEFMALIGRHAGLPITMAWGVVLAVILLLCGEPQSRDALLGHGKALSLISTGLLLLVLSLTAVCWSLT